MSAAAESPPPLDHYPVPGLPFVLTLERSARDPGRWIRADLADAAAPAEPLVTLHLPHFIECHPAMARGIALLALLNLHEGVPVVDLRVYPPGW
jgi:hypothetical protein